MGRAPTPAPLSVSEQDAHIRLCEFYGKVGILISGSERNPAHAHFVSQFRSLVRRSPLRSEVGNLERVVNQLAHFVSQSARWSLLGLYTGAVLEIKKGTPVYGCGAFLKES